MPTSRARSFGAVAAAYAEHRPGYPAAALDWALAPIAASEPRERTLLDLGAGTGKLTTALLGRGTVIAVEPDPAMLAELRRRLPDVDAREGSAESIPLPTGSVDTVLVGQAWHWFDTGRALPELARVLRPGGVLAALWNADDHGVEWVAELHRAARGGAAGARHRERRGAAGVRRARRLRPERVRPVRQPDPDRDGAAPGHPGHAFLGAGQ
jgi:SAM-dependent methyltransferase